MDRQTKQAVVFYGTGIAALVASAVVRRSVSLRKYSPLMFDPNQRPPSFNMMKDAIQAVSNATILSVSSFSFGLATVAWVGNISTLQEFGTMMKNKLGGAEHERQIAAMPVEKDVAELEKSLGDSLK